MPFSDRRTVTWYIYGSTAGFYTFQWGVGTDTPVPADYDGDGKTDWPFIALRPEHGMPPRVRMRGQYLAETWGNYGDQPAPADYDADGKADFSIFRPTTGVWHTNKAPADAYNFTALGNTQDTAVSSAYIKQTGGQVASLRYDDNQAFAEKFDRRHRSIFEELGWSSGLVGLSGRAGLDMGFGISYNSLIWTKQTDSSSGNSTMYFDVDNSNVCRDFASDFRRSSLCITTRRPGRFLI